MLPDPLDFNACSGLAVTLVAVVCGAIATNGQEQLKRIGATAGGVVFLVCFFGSLVRRHHPLDFFIKCCELGAAAVGICNLLAAVIHHLLAVPARRLELWKEAKGRAEDQRRYDERHEKEEAEKQRRWEIEMAHKAAVDRQRLELEKQRLELEAQVRAAKVNATINPADGTFVIVQTPPPPTLEERLQESERQFQVDMQIAQSYPEHLRESKEAWATLQKAKRLDAIMQSSSPNVPWIDPANEMLKQITGS